MKGTLSQKKAIKLLKENGWTQAREASISEAKLKELHRWS
jgi:hypothetical protein